MKTFQKIVIIGIVIISLGLMTSCDNFTTCKNIEHSEMTLLFDISDESLFREINEDIISNFSVFMRQTDFANVQECQQVTMSIGTLSGLDELKIKSATIGVLKKGLSGREFRKRTNPKQIVQLIKNGLKDYTAMSKDSKYNSSTNILQTTVKSLVGMDDDSKNTLVIFSDMIINNKAEKVNFYRIIPNDVPTTVRKLVDPVLRNKLKEKIASGMRLKVIVVQKSNANYMIDKKTVKVFWAACFNVLGIEDVQFIDNLTNKIIWD